LDSFNGSIYPTREDVFKKLHKKEYSYDEIVEIGHSLSVLLSSIIENQANNDKGIHYYFLCREVNKECIDSALKRRIQSAQNYGAYMDILRRTILYQDDPKIIQKFIDSQPQSYLDKLSIFDLLYFRLLAPKKLRRFFDTILGRKEKQGEGEEQEQEQEQEQQQQQQQLQLQQLQIQQQQQQQLQQQLQQQQLLL
jgi:hypothetical protein